MSSKLQATSNSPASEELSTSIPRNPGRSYRPPSIEGLDFSPLPPAVEDELVQQLFTPVEPSNEVLELAIAEPPAWSLDDDGMNNSLFGDGQHGDERELGQENQRKTMSMTGSTPASFPSTPSYEPTPTLRPQECSSSPSSISTHTSTSSFSALASSTSTYQAKDHNRKRLKRKVGDTRLESRPRASFEKEEE
ncbi:hypothetical protein HYFRA_00001141 [Hymenoscyphus fraxineus]|uniref:Uncharacterized protein n=1 Tax=Hymenoscyphus fraxineus TaxID=746836 RepID=A0A9N9KR57_9HELO|nr:hypothetical protein HYFRA_00001141 [Hymenoscyphus fraxineus]